MPGAAPSGNPEQPASVSVRAAVPGDVPALHSVVSESMRIYRENSGISREQLEASFETAADVLEAIALMPVFVAVRTDGSIVGSVRLPGRKVSSFGIPGLAAMLSLDPDNMVGYFSRFAVHEDLQGLGIGSLLYRTAECKAKEMQYSHILLHTSLCNRTMVAFYEKRGFTLLCGDSCRGYPRGLFCKKLI